MRGEHQWAEKAPCQSPFQSAREPWGPTPTSVSRSSHLKVSAVYAWGQSGWG